MIIEDSIFCWWGNPSVAVVWHFLRKKRKCFRFKNFSLVLDICKKTYCCNFMLLQTIKHQQKLIYDGRQTVMLKFRGLCPAHECGGQVSSPHTPAHFRVRSAGTHSREHGCHVTHSGNNREWKHGQNGRGEKWDWMMRQKRTEGRMERTFLITRGHYLLN